MQSAPSHFALNQILNTHVQYIKGVGPKKAEAFKDLKIKVIKDLLLHLPTSFIDRRSIAPLSQIISGSIISQIVTIDAIDIKHKAAPSKIYCSNATGTISLVYFNAHKKFIQEKFRLGDSVVISGKVEKHFGEVQMIHPDIVESAMLKDAVLTIEPVYSATARLTSRAIAKTIHAALNYIIQIPEWLPIELLERYKWHDWLECINKLHKPQVDQDLAQIDKFKERLAFDELLAEQILLQRMRKHTTLKDKQPIQASGNLLVKLTKALPFQLTPDQNASIDEILKEQASPKRMFRLLQGDVGSGKTIVAFAAMINAVEAGYQAALMAPTELLAKQHFYNLQKLTEGFGMKVALLINKLSTKDKAESYSRIERGDAQLVIGTHSLIQDAVKFARLGLVIVDEQHRFGVEQRLKLLKKGMICDFLMMSATPIPRTMTMVCYGDMDLSTIKSKPLNRLPITTTILSIKRLDELMNRISSAVQEGQKVYWVCPLIEESESLELTNVIARFDSLIPIFQNKLALLHGKLSAETRDAVIEDFANPDGQVKIIVSTTVIEVGIDIPDATIIVIEHAERFGLAQLHQLRGRVGRGEQPSHCILLYSYPISAVGKQRIEAVRDSNDGFYLAEQDLLIRGGGKVIGKQQSGIPEFKVCNLYTHQHLIEPAHTLAKQLLQSSSDIQHKVLDVMHNIYGTESNHIGAYKI